MTTLTKQDEKTPFRVGETYRTRDGAVVATFQGGHMRDPDLVVFEDDSGKRFPRWPSGQIWGRTRAQLLTFDDFVPGELHQVNGEWVPVEESDLPELAKNYVKREEAKAESLAASTHPADLKMRLRDLKAGPKPAPVVLPAAPVSTAKPALASLTRITAMSHMLGTGIKG